MTKEEILRAYFGVRNVDDVWANPRSIDIVIDQQGLCDAPLEERFRLQKQAEMKLTVLMSDIDRPFRLSKSCDLKQHHLAAKAILEESTDKWRLAFVEAEAGQKTRFRLYYVHESFLPYDDSLNDLKIMLSEGNSRFRRKVCILDHVAENFFALLEIGENLAYVIERRDAGNPDCQKSFAAITEIRRTHATNQASIIRKTREVQRITSNYDAGGWEFASFFERLPVNALGVVQDPNYKPCWTHAYHKKLPNGWE